MKNLIFCICLLLCSLAQAQPVSFGGITPGKTTREELKSLISEKSLLDLDKNRNDVETDRSSVNVDLKDLDGIWVTVDFQGDVIYRVMLTLLWLEADIKPGLLRKHGAPKIKSGGIRTVTCRNGFGASFVRFQGEEELRWPIKNGVQALSTREASSCSKYVTENYVIHHVATSKALNAAELAKEEKQSESKQKKIDAAL